MRSLSRVLEPEIMDSAEEARDYDAMDHSAVNRVFAADFQTHYRGVGPVLDVGTGTAQIPIELCRQHPTIRVVAIDAARHMLELGRKNVTAAGFEGRIGLDVVDAKAMPYPDGQFAAVMSNSIVHHIPDPPSVFREMVRVLSPGGVVFVRDLLRPETEETLRHLVNLYTAGANSHQQRMFAESLHAALSLDEVRRIVEQCGFSATGVQQTTDRHWTWVAVKPA